MSAGELRRRIATLERRLDEIEAIAKAKATQPPGDHAELAKEARELANRIFEDYDNKTPLRGASMLRALADLVEAQDARINRLADANIGWANTRHSKAILLDRYAKSQPELVAACNACAEVITTVLKAYPLSGPHGDLEDARERAERAVANAPNARIDETIAIATAEYGPLLEKLGDTTNHPPPSNAELREWASRSENQPPASWWNATDDPFKPEPARAAPAGVTPAEHDATLKGLGDDDFMPADEFKRRMEQSHPVPPPIDKSTTIAQIIETLREGRAVLPTVYQWRDVEKDLTDFVKEQSVSAPIEVEMRVTHPAQHEWGWECLLGGHWVNQPDRYGAFWTTDSGARNDAIQWLAALSEQLGVKLEAKWEGKQTTLKVETCEVCHIEYECDKPRVPYVCADCTEQYGDRVANPKDGE